MLCTIAYAIMSSIEFPYASRMQLSEPAPAMELSERMQLVLELIDDDLDHTMGIPPVLNSSLRISRSPSV